MSSRTIRPPTNLWRKLPPSNRSAECRTGSCGQHVLQRQTACCGRTGSGIDQTLSHPRDRKLHALPRCPDELFEEVQQPSLTCRSCDVKPKAHQCRCHNAVAKDVADVTVAQCPCRQSLVAHIATPKANNQREERKGQCWQQPRRRGVLETAQKLAHLVVRQCPAKLPDHEHEDLRQTDTADQLCNSEEFIQLRWQQTFLSQDLGLVEPLLRMQANLKQEISAFGVRFASHSSSKHPSRCAVGMAASFPF